MSDTLERLNAINWLDERDTCNPCRMQWNKESFEVLKAGLEDIAGAKEDAKADLEQAEANTEEIREGLKDVLMWLQVEAETYFNAEGPDRISKAEDFFDSLENEIKAVCREHRIKL